MLTQDDIRWINSNLTTNANVNGNGNGTCKQRVNTELTQSKQLVNNMVLAFNYRTPPRKIAQFLDRLFEDPNTKGDHWLYIAQNYNPRAIQRVLEHMIKCEERGDVTIKNYAAYFTHLIKFRKKRRGPS